MRTNCGICLILAAICILPSLSAKELADKSELYTGPEYQKAFNNPKDNPDLPNVLLIGDSISIGYTVDVRKKLAGKADVFRIPTNGRYASYGVEHLDEWLTKPGVKWDVIHFNWGLWDICYRHPKSKVQGKRDKVNGKICANPEKYREFMEKAVARLKKTGAKLIWCATTPVPADEAGRIEGDEVKYNAIAAEIMEKNGIAIDDLHTHACQKTPGIFKKKGNVHFKNEGYTFLAEKVADEITKALDQK